MSNMIAVIGDISFVGLIVFIVLAIRTRKKNTSKSKTMWIFAAGCFVILGICFALDPGSSQTSNASSNQTTSTKQTVSKSSKPAIASVKKPKSNAPVENTQQKTMTSFLNQINKIQQPVSDANANLINALEQYNGSDTTALSDAAIQLENATADAENKVPSAPSGFSDDVDTLLTDASNNFTLAYNDAYNAADSLSKYIESQNPNDMQNYKDKFGKATDYLSQANMDLKQAKQDVGIK